MGIGGIKKLTKGRVLGREEEKATKDRFRKVWFKQATGRGEGGLNEGNRMAMTDQSEKRA